METHSRRSRRRRARLVATVALAGAALALLPVLAHALLPVLAHACSRPWDPPQPLSIAERDLRFPFRYDSTRAAWGVGHAWQAERPGLMQVIRLQGWDERRSVNAAYRQQRALTVWARDRGALAGDDGDEATPPCAIAGQRTWTRPSFLVRETSRAIFITAITRRTPGSLEGCSFAINSCETARERSFRLAAPVGARRIFMTRFA